MGYDCPDGMSWDAANAMCVGSTNFSYSETSYMDGGSFSSGGGNMMMMDGGMSGGSSYMEYSSSSMGGGMGGTVADCVAMFGEGDW
jgi:hypothetical protein